MDTLTELAVSFLKMVVSGNIHEAYQKFVDPNMRHHNAYFKGDAQSLEKAMEENHQKFPVKTFDIKHTFEQGDLVAVHSHVRMNKEDKGIAVVHMFRFENGKIIEMWDIGQPVPENNPNENGMF